MSKKQVEIANLFLIFSLQLFQRCLIKVLNIDLWKCYLNYVRDTKGKSSSFRFEFILIFSRINFDISSEKKWLKHMILHQKKSAWMFIHIQYGLIMQLFLKLCKKLKRFQIEYSFIFKVMLLVHMLKIKKSQLFEKFIKKVL